MCTTRYLIGSFATLAALTLAIGCGTDERSPSGDHSADETYNGNPHSENAQEEPRSPDPQPGPTYDQSSPVYYDMSPPPAGELYSNDEAPRSGEVYDQLTENEFIDTSAENTSTFSIDIDTASYTIMRRDVEQGRLPAPESVRPEEYINYFDYPYPEPSNEHPFSINMEAAPSRFGEDLHMLRIGLRGKNVTLADLKPTNLVFLVDVSGSMQSPRKLPMVKRSILSLLDHLRPTDTISIVRYADGGGVSLQPTNVSERSTIEHVVNGLTSGGGTNAEAGIVEAYKLAEQAKKPNGNNRVIIMTDGDFNIGKTGEELFKIIEDYRAKEISLTCVGYGLGNYNDHHMEQLSNRGNGNYFYIDSEAEAGRVFGTELAGTLEVIAADVKIQVEFNADAVASYRLVGYENRLLENEDFDDDAKDAGEIGPGHTVTAYYELALKPDAADEAMLSEVRIRYKSQYGEDSILQTNLVKMSSVHESFESASASFRFGAAVAEYAEVLRESKHVATPDLGAVEQVAQAAQWGDAKQTEFMTLVAKAKTLTP